MPIFNTPAEVCEWANTEGICCQLTEAQMQKAILLLACSINSVILDELVVLLTDIDADVSAIYTLLDNYFNAPNNWILESTFGEDLTIGAVQMIAAPGVGFRLEVRYLSYGNSSTTAGVLGFVSNGGSNIYTNWTVQGSIWATRFNKGDYLLLDENEPLLLASALDDIDAASASWEYRVVPA